jgi:hypothetical protein
MTKLETLLACIPESPFKQQLIEEIAAATEPLRKRIEELDGHLVRHIQFCVKKDEQISAATEQHERDVATLECWNKAITQLQAENVKLREALHYSLGAWHYDGVSDEHGSIFKEANDRCDKPTDTTALQAAIDAAYERAAVVCDRFQARDVGMQPAECAGAIRLMKGTS